MDKINETNCIVLWGTEMKQDRLGGSRLLYPSRYEEMKKNNNEVIKFHFSQSP